VAGDQPVQGVDQAGGDEQQRAEHPEPLQGQPGRAADPEEPQDRDGVRCDAAAVDDPPDGGAEALPGAGVELLR
jgi:hypothetical protein